VAGERILGFEMFEARILQDPQKLIAYGRTMAMLRTISRNAKPTPCHDYIAKLHEMGRLLRCYTQNIDGLQTRGRPHLAKVVLELHGNIQTLKCNRCSNTPDENGQQIDQDLERDGYVHCKKCQHRGGIQVSSVLPNVLTYECRPSWI
jgi:NAD-dependent histone deacetylase SIR2